MDREDNCAGSGIHKCLCFTALNSSLSMFYSQDKWSLNMDEVYMLNDQIKKKAKSKVVSNEQLLE